MSFIERCAWGLGMVAAMGVVVWMLPGEPSPQFDWYAGWFVGWMIGTYFPTGGNTSGKAAGE